MSSWYHGLPCWFCGGDATTRDHLIPKAKGGVDQRTLLVPACRVCNGVKDAWSVEEFRDYVRLTPALTPEFDRIREQGYRFYGEMTAIPAVQSKRTQFPKKRARRRKRASTRVSMSEVQSQVRTNSTHGERQAVEMPQVWDAGADGAERAGAA